MALLRPDDIPPPPLEERAPHLLPPDRRPRSTPIARPVTEELADLSGDALCAIADMLSDPGEKKRDKAEMARWVLEMIGGKAKQQVAVDGGTSVLQILQALKALQSPGEKTDAQREVLELAAPKATTEEDWAAKWVRENADSEEEK